MNNALRSYMVSKISEEVKREIDRAESIHGSFHSLHEGLAVLREEYKELEEQIFWRAERAGNTKGVRSEAIQVCAMALRIAMMVTTPPEKDFSMTDAENEVD